MKFQKHYNIWSFKNITKYEVSKTLQYMKFWIKIPKMFYKSLQLYLDASQNQPYLQKSILNIKTKENIDDGEFVNDRLNQRPIAMTILIRWKRLMALLMKSHWGWTVRCHVILGKPNQNLVINEYTDKSLQKRPLEMIWNCVKILWILQNWSCPWILGEDWVTKLKLLGSNFFN